MTRFFFLVRPIHNCEEEELLLGRKEEEEEGDLMLSEGEEPPRSPHEKWSTAMKRGEGGRKRNKRREGKRGYVRLEEEEEEICPQSGKKLCVLPCFAGGPGNTAWDMGRGKKERRGGEQ